jgi:hypothetical protein
MLTLCIRCEMRPRKINRRICAECYAVQNRAVMKEVGKRPAVRVRRAAYSAQQYALPKKRLKMLFISAKHGSKKRGIEFKLGAEWLAAQSLEKCAATGIPFDFERPPDGLSRHPWAPSIDRIDSSKGYVPGNVHFVCWAYNVAKHEFSVGVLLTLARAIVDAAPKSGV